MVARGSVILVVVARGSVILVVMIIILLSLMRQYQYAVKQILALGLMTKRFVVRET